MPNDKPLRRKLAAILAADVVGYSKKMGESEERTLRNLKRCRQITDKSILQHHGRIFHTAGDSLIAEFASPLDAILAAIEFQAELRVRNAACSLGDDIQFRVGVHLGDVIVEGDNLFGEGINIAARIESIAIPGGVSVSQSVFSVVRKNLSHTEFCSRGLQALKNIDEPIEVFDMVDAESTITAPSPPPGADKSMTQNLKPNVLVQNFQTAGGDESIAAFATGLLEGIVSSLMRSSAFWWVRQAPISPKQMPAVGAAQEQIFFRVVGSVQVAAEKLRIFINLENGTTGTQIWSKRFDKPKRDFFEIQDEIVQKVNLAIRHKIKEATLLRLERCPTAHCLFRIYWTKLQACLFVMGKNRSSRHNLAWIWRWHVSPRTLWR